MKLWDTAFLFAESEADQVATVEDIVHARKVSWTWCARNSTARKSAEYPLYVESFTCNVHYLRYMNLTRTDECTSRACPLTARRRDSSVCDLVSHVNMAGAKIISIPKNNNVLVRVTLLPQRERCWS